MASITLTPQKNYKKDDDYETTEYIWGLIKTYLSNYSTIYEPFYCNGKSGEIFTKFGFDCIHKDEDFFENYNNYDYDIIVSNPPFSIKKQIFHTLKEIDKPFIMIAPISVITKVYFREKYENTDITILIPKKRMQFSKNDVVQGGSWFDSVFICYKLGLDKEIIYL